MSAESKQQMQGCHGDDVREKLLLLVKFHAAVSHEMDKVRSEQRERAAGRARDSEAEKVEAGQRLMSCLRLIAEMTASQEPNTTPEVDQELMNVDVEYVGEKATLLIEQLAEKQLHHTQANKELLGRNHKLQIHGTELKFVVFVLALALYVFTR